MNVRCLRFIFTGLQQKKPTVSAGYRENYTGNKMRRHSYFASDLLGGRTASLSPLPPRSVKIFAFCAGHGATSLYSAATRRTSVQSPTVSTFVKGPWIYYNVHGIQNTKYTDDDDDDGSNVNNNRKSFSLLNIFFFERSNCRGCRRRCYRDSSITERNANAVRKPFPSCQYYCVRC